MEESGENLYLTYRLKESMTDNLKWLKNHNELCDVLLVSGRHKVSAHSCVLGSHSPILAAILQARLAVNNDWSILSPLIISIEEDQKPIDCYSSINEDCHERSVLELLIAFIYGEEIMIKQTRVQELINFSKLLGLAQHFTSTTEMEPSKEPNCLPIKRKSKRKLAERNSKFKSNEANVNLVTKYCKSDETRARKRGATFCSGKESKVNAFNRTRITRKKKLSAKMRMKFRSNFKKFIKKIVTVNTESPSHPQGEMEGLHSRASTVPEKTSLIIDNSNNFTDAELWFKNELQSVSEIKVEKVEDNFANADIILTEREESHFADIGNEDSFGPKGCSTNPLKKATRVATACSACKGSFHRVSDLIKHVKEKLHYSQVCPLCFLQLGDFEEQKEHFEQHDHPLPFFCLCCELRFRSRAGLTMHAPKHSDTKPYTCEECGRGFKWRHSAQAHSIIHRNHCQLLCDICGFSSKYASTFKSHLKRHYDQFLPCPHPGCQFKSFRKTHLNDHIATHAKLRSHQCEVCGHSFSQAKNLRRHMRLHTPDTCFLKCAFYSGQGCPFKTTRPDKLRCHLIQKHNLKHHDKISLPAVAPSSHLSLGEEIPTNGLQAVPGKEASASITNSEGIATFKTLDFEAQQFEVKEEIFPPLEASSAKESDEGEVKSTEVDVLPSDISDILLDDEGSMIPSGDRGNSDSLCISDSYETYVIPSTSQDNAVILSENMEFNNQTMEGDSTLVLMGNIEVLTNLPSEETLSTSEIQESPFEPEKTVITSSKIEQMMDTLPVILQTDKNLTYLHTGHMTLSQTDRSREYGDNNIEEFNLHRDCNMTIEDTNRTLQFIKLSDSSITFLPHDHEESTVSMENSSVTLENDESELKGTDGFKPFAPSQFSLF